MNLIKAIKDRYTQAENEIRSDYHFTGNGNISCPHHEDENPSCGWMPDANSFGCFSCRSQYDIVNHYEMFHGMEKSDAIKCLAEKLGIDLSTYEMPEPLLRKKARVTPNPEFVNKVSNFNPATIYADKYLSNKGIDPELAREMYWLTSSADELFYNHAEFDLSTGEWFYSSSKRRKSDGSDYINEKGSFKEMSVKGGQNCFYGLQTLTDKKGICFITEGQNDCLRWATELKKAGSIDVCAVLSVPNGGRSLKSAIENSPTFNRWYRKHCKLIVIIPDADKCGMSMRDDAALYFDEDKVKWIDFTSLDKISYREKHGQDLSDALDLGYTCSEIQACMDFMPDEVEKASDVETFFLEDGIACGFATHDYNDNGLKAGRVTIVTGTRGSGKTSICRQMVLNIAKQGIKTLNYFGESSISEEKANFALLSADKGEIDMEQSTFGRKIYTASRKAEQRFDSSYGKYINFWEPTLSCQDIYTDLLATMKKHAKRGVKIFMIDSLMMLTTGKDNVFAKQTTVITGLKEFAKETGTHVLLIAHLNASGTKISGAMEIENFVDTIIKYERIDKVEDKSQYISMTQMDADEMNNMTAIVTNTKVRDKGAQIPMFLEWDEQRGQVTDVVWYTGILPLAGDYFQKGYNSRAVMRKWAVVDEIEDKQADWA